MPYYDVGTFHGGYYLLPNAEEIVPLINEQFNPYNRGRGDAGGLLRADAAASGDSPAAGLALPPLGIQQRAPRYVAGAVVPADEHLQVVKGVFEGNGQRGSEAEEYDENW